MPIPANTDASVMVTPVLEALDYVLRPGGIVLIGHQPRFTVRSYTSVTLLSYGLILLSTHMNTHEHTHTHTNTRTHTNTHT
eukprot:1068181-Prorocentrum_minimum.AAC.6